MQITNNFAVNTATLSFTLDKTYFPLAWLASTLGSIRVVGIISFANTQTRRLLLLEGSLSPSEEGLDAPKALSSKSSKMHHLSQMSKIQSSGSALALKQMRNVALAQGVDPADSALLKLLLRQSPALPLGAQSFLQVGEGHSSGVRSETPFIVGPPKAKGR